MTETTDTQPKQKKLFIIKSGSTKHLIEAQTIQAANKFAEFLFEGKSFSVRSPYWWEYGSEIWWIV